MTKRSVTDYVRLTTDIPSVSTDISQAVVGEQPANQYFQCQRPPNERQSAATHDLSDDVWCSTGSRYKAAKGISERL